jgi:2-amino-4-hydroxy-6-hydroxymethyldihydropteridine diphosphokinase
LAHIVYLGLGSNLGDKRANIQRAIDCIGELVGTVERVSSFYETEPWGFQSEHSFVNAVIAVSTTSGAYSYWPSS